VNEYIWGSLIFKNSNLFSQTFANHTPIKPFIVLSTTESTNNYAMAKLHAGMVEHVACFFAIEQTKGRGQRGKQWISKPGDNITMSTVFSATNCISANVTAFPFVMSAAMALGCYDFIKDCGLPDLSIKWPNDIYVGDRKAAGILIENVYRGSIWDWSVVGTGININQDSFPPEAGRAVSFKLVAGTHYNTLKLGKTLFTFLINRFAMLKSASIATIMDEYNAHLYMRGRSVRIRKENIVFSAIINKVSKSGEIHVTGSTEQTFNAGEVEFV
jgi:BirA family transcriptional regulator, biotin operon repressor / biotin---[acetyl-CoA-carboxylase] ligase